MYGTILSQKSELLSSLDFSSKFEVLNNLVLDGQYSRMNEETKSKSNFLGLCMTFHQRWILGVADILNLSLGS